MDYLARGETCQGIEFLRGSNWAENDKDVI